MGFRPSGDGVETCALSLIAAGGIGNAIDRFVNGFVVDFIDLTFMISVFNIADIGVTCGFVLLVIGYLLATRARLARRQRRLVMKGRRRIMTDVARVEVAAEYAGMRLDALWPLRACIPRVPPPPSALRMGALPLNGRIARKSATVAAGDVLEYETYDDPHAPVLEAVEIPLDIRYEDEYLMVISKQAGLVCHPSDGHFGDTLVNALIAHCGREHLCDVQGEPTVFGIVIVSTRIQAVLCCAPKPTKSGSHSWRTFGRAMWTVITWLSFKGGFLLRPAWWMLRLPAATVTVCA